MRSAERKRQIEERLARRFNHLGIHEIPQTILRLAEAHVISETVSVGTDQLDELSQIMRYFIGRFGGLSVANPILEHVREIEGSETVTETSILPILNDILQYSQSPLRKPVWLYEGF